MRLQHIETGKILNTNDIDLNLQLVKIGEVHYRLSEFIELTKKDVNPTC